MPEYERLVDRLRFGSLIASDHLVQGGALRKRLDLIKLASLAVRESREVAEITRAGLMMPEFEERALFLGDRGERPLSSRGLLQEALEAGGMVTVQEPSKRLPEPVLIMPPVGQALFSARDPLM